MFLTEEAYGWLAGSVNKVFGPGPYWFASQVCKYAARWSVDMRVWSVKISCPGLRIYWAAGAIRNIPDLLVCCAGLCKGCRGLWILFRDLSLSEIYTTLRICEYAGSVAIFSGSVDTPVQVWGSPVRVCKSSVGVCGSLIRVCGSRIRVCGSRIRVCGVWGSLIRILWISNPGLWISSLGSVDL